MIIKQRIEDATKNVQAEGRGLCRVLAVGVLLAVATMSDISSNAVAAMVAAQSAVTVSNAVAEVQVLADDVLETSGKDTLAAGVIGALIGAAAAGGAVAISRSDDKEDGKDDGKEIGGRA